MSAGVEIARNAANGAALFAATSESDMFWSALGGVSCVVSLFPGGSLISGILDGIGTVKNVAEAGAKCFGGTSATQTSVSSLDPNELAGPAGGGATHAIGTDGVHTFAVYFENAKTATAPAQEVRITDQLDPAQYDVSTLSFGAIQIGTTRWTPASDATSVSDVLDLGSGTGLQLDMQASVDPQGHVQWDLRAEDIVTGTLPEDPSRGFLPPNADGTQGQGVVYFSVKPKHVADGTVLSSHADIVFDLNPPLPTNTWTNLVDNTVPTAKATAPTSVTTRTFTVSWNGSDATSGVTSYDVLVADGQRPVRDLAARCRGRQRDVHRDGRTPLPRLRGRSRRRGERLADPADTARDHLGPRRHRTERRRSDRHQVRQLVGRVHTGQGRQHRCGAAERHGDAVQAVLVHRRVVSGRVGEDELLGHREHHPGAQGIHAVPAALRRRPGTRPGHVRRTGGVGRAGRLRARDRLHGGARGDGEALRDGQPGRYEPGRVSATPVRHDLADGHQREADQPEAPERRHHRRLRVPGQAQHSRHLPLPGLQAGGTAPARRLLGHREHQGDMTRQISQDGPSMAR